MLGLAALGLVAAASAIIGASAALGTRRGTLRETEQERFDRRFLDIVIADRYSAPRSPRRHP